MVELEQLKRIVARVDIDGKPNGTAFLVARNFVVTAAHVLDRRKKVKLNFVAWKRADSEFEGKLKWSHPAGRDVVILELDRECPDEVVLLPCVATTPAVREPWMTFGFPAQIPVGHPLNGPDEYVTDPQGGESGVDMIQLHTPAAKELLIGFSGSPCVIGGAILGVITNQLERSKVRRAGRSRPDAAAKKLAKRPSLETVYALPAAVLSSSGYVELSPGRLRAPATHAKLYGVPQLPTQHLERADFVNVKRVLVSADASPSRIAGQAICALQGMAGVGKTMFAVALARDREVLQAYSDGVFWFALGRHPNPSILLVNRLIAAISGEPSTYSSLTEAQARAQELLESRACLLVLDDVWDGRGVDAFRVLGERSKLLITTRKLTVSGMFAPDTTTNLSKLPEKDAFELLARYAGIARSKMPNEAQDIVRGCGELPLALAMVGSQLRGRPADRWMTMRGRLDSADISSLQCALPGYPHGGLLAAISVSLEDVSPEHRALYLQLAVFPEDTPIPQAALALYWNIDDVDAQATIDAFVDQALATLDSAGSLLLHDLQRDYLLTRVGSVTELHQQLVCAYRRVGGGELFRVPDDGYGFDHLAAHVYAAEGVTELHALVFNLEWLRRRLEATDLRRLLADFALHATAETEALKAALLQASHVLNHSERRRSGDLLAAQILARLQHRTELQLCELCARARTWIRGHRALEPLTPSLHCDDALVLTLTGHEGPITALAVLPDGRLASGAVDETVRIWNVETMRCEATLAGHTIAVRALAVLRDGRLAASSRDDKIRLWNTETASCEAMLEGHRSDVRNMAVLVDGRLAAGSHDTIKLWDTAVERCEATLEPTDCVLASLPDGRLASRSHHAIDLWNLAAGTREATLVGHTDLIQVLTALPDGRLASGGADASIKLWNPKTLRCDVTFEDPSGEVSVLAGLPDGRVASGAQDTSIKLWDPETGTCEATLEGHSESVSALEHRTG